jgi:hypothetical protein
MPKGPIVKSDSSATLTYKRNNTNGADLKLFIHSLMNEWFVVSVTDIFKL